MQSEDKIKYKTHIYCNKLHPQPSEKDTIIHYTVKLLLTCIRVGSQCNFVLKYIFEFIEVHSVDTILRKEQSGFRRNRSCTDNIFCLRKIIEQSLVHRITLWKIMEAYGIPRKIIGIIRDMYDGFRCTVRHEGSTSDWFQLTSGLRQGWIISPFMFLLCIDWIMRLVTGSSRNSLDIHIRSGRYRFRR